MTRRIRFLIWKELLELKADPRLFGILIVAPMLQLLALGYAATTDIENVPVVVVDADRSTASRGLISRFSASPSFAIVDVVSSAREVDSYLERERELGTLEQLNVTPLRRWELIVGKLLPYALVGMVDVCLVIGIAVLWFEVPLRGSVGLLFAMTAVYLLSTLGLGLFVSTISSTQQQAMMTAAFFFMTPRVYLSGFIFPIENMPAFIQPITYLIPLRYFLVILRSIFLKGVGLETVWPQAAALAAWGAAILTLAIARSTKRAA